MVVGGRVVVLGIVVVVVPKIPFITFCSHGGKAPPDCLLFLLDFFFNLGAIY